MEDDPDIGNVNENLIYPKIENIFSNIENIKTEAADYVDNDFDSIEMLDYDSSNDYYMPIPNKIIIGSKPPTTAAELSPEASTSSNWVERQHFQCDQCPLSFLNQAQLNSHSVTHSFLVARPSSRAISTPKSLASEPSHSISDNKAKSSVIRSNAPRRTATKLKKNFLVPKKTLSKDLLKSISVKLNKVGTDKSDGLICTHCNVPFPDEASLIQHTYELIPDKKFRCPVSSCYQSFNSKTELCAHKLGHFKKSNYNGRKLLQCHICSVYFIFPTVLRTHLSKCHNVADFAINYVKFTCKCPFCPRSFADHQHFNKHIANNHYKVYVSKKLVKSKAKVPGDQKTALVKTKFSDLCKKLSEDDMPIPKQTIYRCHKCRIHFVTCTMAYKHSRHCVRVKGDWKCNKCKRKFTQDDRNIHSLQHEVSSKFKVYTVNDKTFSQVLCKCPECELCFNEVDFFNHVAVGCTPSTGFECVVCKLNFHKDSRAIHRSTHNKYNYTATDYILVEYAGMKKERKVFSRNRKNVLRYCTNCKTNQCTARLLTYHLTGECKKLKIRVCQTCGLVFTVKALISHKRQCHQKQNLGLSDLKFVRLQDNEVIAPPIPDYFKCLKCKVRFSTASRKQAHRCKTQVSIKCNLCSKKFDEFTYKLHLGFHEYKMPVAVNDHEVDIVKIFSCTSCNIGFDNYDSLIYHCQNHFTDTQNIADKHCKVCKLKFYESHVTHGEDFRIFNFKHDSLLTDEWLNGFESLSIEEIDKILSTSVHGDVRNVRLKLLKDGPSERSLYKCAQCELYFNVDSIVEHAKDACSKTPRYSCSSCHAVFNTALCLTDHLDVHVIYGDVINFREIVFNEAKDRDLNETLRTGRTKESLKFRKCSHCELLVKKNDYQRHIAAHGETKKVNPVNDAKSGQLLNKTQVTKSKSFVVYTCKHCPAVIMKKVNIVRHTCWTGQKTVVCEKCSLHVRPCSLNQHNYFHSTEPNFVTSNITVIEFESQNEVMKIKKRRHSESEEFRSIAKDNRKDNKSLEKDNRNEGKAKEAVAPIITPQYAPSPYGTRQKLSGKINSNFKDTENVKVPTINDSVEAASLPIIDKWVPEKNKLYQCDKCYLCFMNKKVLICHLFKCEKNLLEAPVSCSLCSLTFHPSLTKFHEKLHELARKAEIESRFYLITISTKGIGLSDENNWLYKCKSCDLHYMSYQAVEGHVLSDHKTSFDNVTCDVCNLKFTMHTSTKHKRIHHGDDRWCKENTNMETLEMKIIGSGDICLTTDDLESGNNRKDVGVKKDNDSNTPKKKKEVPDAADVDGSAQTKNVTEASMISVDNDFDIPESESSLRSHDGLDNKLYKCTTCGIHYVTRRTLELHIKYSEHTVCRSQCFVCGLIFGKGSLSKHLNIQHEILGFTRKDFIIVSLNGEVVTEDKDDVEGNLNEEEDMKEKIDSAEIVSPMKIGAVEGNYLYKCVVCKLHFMFQAQLFDHVSSNHEHKDSNDCDICGLRFDHDSLPSHKSKHHNDLKLSVTDFVIIDETEARVDGKDVHSESAPSIDANDVPLDSTKNVTEERRGCKKIRLYQCKDCRVCVRKAQTKLHVCYSDIKKKQCVYCTLFFSRGDYFEHTRLHNRFKLSRKDFLIVSFGRRSGGLRKKRRIYKCSSCSLHFLSLIALEWHIDGDHKTEKVPCDTCGLDFAKFSIQRHINIHHSKSMQKELDILTVCNDNNLPNLIAESKSIDNTNSESVVIPPDSKSVGKLFKCLECDVHFLTQSSYYKHLYKHEMLDQTEFMPCKMCDLQFLTEALAEHLKSHKDKIFTLDKVAIETYQPDVNRLVSQAYVGADNFDSKQVSTTTPFVDDTVAVSCDEQQSTIDSTSKIDIADDEEVENVVGTQ